MPLPVTIGEQIGQQNSYHGPFTSSNNDVFVPLIESAAASDAELALFRGTDPTTSFNESDSGNRPQMGAAAGDEVLSLNGAQNGDLVYVFTQNDQGAGYFARADMSGNSFVGIWEDVTTTGGDKDQATGINSDGNAIACDGVYRSGQGDLLMVGQHATESDMGTNYERNAFATKANLTTGTWSTPAYIGSNGMGVAVHVTGPRCVYEPVSGRTHVVFKEEVPATSETLNHTSISSGDAITDNGDTSAAVDLLNIFYPIGHGVCFDRDGTKKIRFPYEDADGDFNVLEFDDAASPSYSFAVDIETSAGNFACLAVDGSTVYAAWERGTTDNLYVANDQGTDSWTAGALSFTGTIGPSLSINVFGRDGGVKLAQIFDDGGVIKYDEDDITSAFVLLSSAEFPQQNTFIGPFEA